MLVVWEMLTAVIGAKMEYAPLKRRSTPNNSAHKALVFILAAVRP
jgi:hypothetical protein